MTPTTNSLVRVNELGQSIWLDYIRRDLVRDGELKSLIEQDRLRGVTSNPSIFNKAIAESELYDDDIAAMVAKGQSAEDVYEALVVQEVREAADVLRGVYDESDGRDGYVSLEVSPHLARDTEGTIRQAHELWTLVDRPNVLIKIPGTVEGLPAIRRCLADGINVNITLLFGLPRYREIAEAYMAAIEDRVRDGQPVDRVASVASFFLSRIDVLVDPMLEEEAEGGQDAAAAGSLRGHVAIASAKLAYQIYRQVFESDRFEQLAQKGARTQRVLWASTSTKNPDYSDVMYVDALIGPDTVNTIPMETLRAYRDHGRPERRLEHDLDEATADLELLGRLGIDIDEVTAQLIEEGIEKFNQPFDSLMASLRGKGAK